MPLIDDRSRKVLEEKFSKELTSDVEVRVFIRRINLVDTTSEFNDFTIKLLDELSAISSHIRTVEMNLLDEEGRRYGLRTSPSIMIGADKGYKIIYSGAPLGHEFTSFVETLCLVSRGISGLSPETALLLKNIDMDTRIQVFVTPSCPNCPRSVLLANRMAVEAKGLITAETVEAQEDSVLAQKFNVNAVPQQVINGLEESITIGAQEERPFIEQALKYGSSRYSELKSAWEASAKAGTILPEKPDHPIRLTDSNFNDALKKYPDLMVDFWATWCGPCRMVGPIIEELAGEYNGKVVFGKLDTDQNQETARRFNINSIPTVIAFKKGELAEEIVGAQPKPAYAAAIKKNFGA